VCELTPRVSCLFFDDTCLAALPRGVPTVEAFMSRVTDALSFRSLAAHFGSVLLMMTLLSLGGVPTPHHTHMGSVLWYSYMLVHGVQYVLVLLATLTDVLSFLALRAHTHACLTHSAWAFGARVIDVAALLSAFNLPLLTERLLLLFLLAHLLARGRAAYRDETAELAQGYHSYHTLNEKRDVLGKRDALALPPKTSSIWRLASAHSSLMLAALCLTAVFAVCTFAILPGLAYLPTSIFFGALVALTYVLVPRVEAAFPYTCAPSDGTPPNHSS
jgi:hypothetical protein